MKDKTPYGKVDSKFQFVILAAKRARQLLKGAKPKIRTKSRNPIRIAQMEVKMGAVDFDILKATAREEEAEQEKQVIVSEGGTEEIEGIPSLPTVVTEEEEEVVEEEEEEKWGKFYEEEAAEEEEESEPPEKESEEE